ncbi:MAG: hypothetical protein ACRD99_04930, partial [Nitrososphaera sp.]
MGAEESLNDFLDEFGREKFSARLGRSKITQYGRVTIGFGKIAEVNELPANTFSEIAEEEPVFTLTCLSPFI